MKRRLNYRVGTHQGEAADYRAGGPRGEIARGNADETKITAETISSRSVTCTAAMLGECAATAKPAVEQIGQTWEAEGAAVKSVQK
jgi:hypothetical protein